jgi:DTW domain-containing protein YfiP
MRKELCLCDAIAPLDLKTQVVLLVHHREIRSPSNTGQLACLCLKNSKVVVRGLPHQDSNLEPFLNPEREALLFYPSSDAQILNQSFIDALKKPVTLFVPDGSWRQASKVCTREKALRGITRVKLAEGAPSQYRLRREPKPEGLATMEAIARAMCILEGAKVQTELERIFLLMVERVLWSRGKIPLSQCRDKIPAWA